MGPVVTVADAGDDRLDDYRNLTDRELRRRQEVSGGCFIGEGLLVIRQLLASPYLVRSLLLTPSRLEQLSVDLEAAGGPAPIYLASEEVMAQVAGFRFHRGALACASRLAPVEMAEVLMSPGKLILAAEGINDHENLGALFRNAAAFGIDAVLLSPDCADPLYRRSIRVSMGQVLRVRWARATSWPGVLDDIRSAGYRLVALTPDPGADSLAAFARHVPAADRLAVLVGAEGGGLSREALAAADHRIRIPLATGVDSVNVATAAAIAFHRLAVLPAPSSRGAAYDRPMPT